MGNYCAENPFAVLRVNPGLPTSAGDMRPANPSWLVLPLACWPVGAVSPTVAVEDNGFLRDKQPAGHCCPFGNAGVK